MSCIFFFNDTATTEIYTLSLHDALPISHELLPDGGVHVRLERDRAARPVAPPPLGPVRPPRRGPARGRALAGGRAPPADRKSTRLNSSHANISYAVFCLTKKTDRLTHNG